MRRICASCNRYEVALVRGDGRHCSGCWCDKIEGLLLGFVEGTTSQNEVENLSVHFMKVRFASHE